MNKVLIKFIRLSPTKARLVARRVQGMNAELAMTNLKFMPDKGAKYIADAISSVVVGDSSEASEVMMKSCRVDAGVVSKRLRPRARRSASRTKKLTSYILVEVAKAEVRTEAKEAVAKKTPIRKTGTKKVAVEKES